MLRIFLESRVKIGAGTLGTDGALMVPIVAAMVADGRVDDQEIDQIHSICKSSPIYDRNSWTDNDSLIGSVLRLIEDHGAELMCRQAAEQLSPALRETAFVYAVMVIFSDGHVGKLEREVIENLIKWMSLPEDRARIMIEVVTIMRRTTNA